MKQYFAYLLDLILAASAAPAMPLTLEEQQALSPQAVLERLAAGNERFQSGSLQARDHRASVAAAAADQYPMAYILS